MSHVCTGCGNITNMWFMCDLDETNFELCSDCFDKTPCGKGEHAEDCQTSVFDGE